MKSIKEFLSKVRPASKIPIRPAPSSASTPPAAEAKIIQRILVKQGTLENHSPSLTAAEDSVLKAATPEEPSVENKCLSEFELLPFDIRHQILLALNSLEDLRSLVHASPTFHQQYVEKRDFWLWRRLWLEMGDVLVDAYTVNLLNSSNCRQDRTHKQVRNHIAAYELRRTTPDDILFTLPSSDEVISTVIFHSSIIRPLLKAFVAWTRSYRNDLSAPAEISITEERRIFRGLYRFELFSCLFGRAYGGSEAGSREDDRLALFFNLYEPWEVEEIACINSFADSHYEKVLDSVEWDFSQDNPRFDEVRRDMFTPPGAFQIKWHGVTYRRGLMASGLPLLHATLTVREHSDLVDILSTKMFLLWEDWLDDAIDESAQDRRRQIRMTERDEAQIRRDEMPFMGDTLGSPPLAWVIIWQQTYSNLYGGHIVPYLRLWGYIMWDSSRLADSGIATVLEEEWKACCTMPNGDFVDPRDFV